MRTLTKRSAAVLATTALALTAGGVAYAFWTSDGSGTGTATTGTTANVVVLQGTTVADLGPGEAAQALSGTFDNQNEETVRVERVRITGLTTNQAGCTRADYLLTQPADTDAQLAPGAGGTWGGASIQFYNAPDRNQDVCKNATVTLTYTIDNAPVRTATPFETNPTA